MSPEKEKSFKEHINKEVRSFKKKMLQLAIENDHPYVVAILEGALRKMQENIIQGTCDCRANEYRLKGWNIK